MFPPPPQVKELSSRAEFLRAEREKALKLLHAEQQQSASLRQSVEALQSQARGEDRGGSDGREVGWGGGRGSDGWAAGEGEGVIFARDGGEAFCW